MNLSDIKDKPLLIAVAMARESFNASQPVQVQTGVDKEGKPIMVDNPALFASDEAYFDARCMDMVKSWAGQYQTDLTAIDSKISDLQAKRAEIVAKG